MQTSHIAAYISIAEGSGETGLNNKLGIREPNTLTTCLVTFIYCMTLLSPEYT